MTMQGFRTSQGPAIIEDRRRSVTGSERIYQLIAAYWQAVGYSPSIRELSDLSGYVVSTVYYHLGRLQDAGRIKMKPRTARGIVVIK